MLKEVKNVEGKDISLHVEVESIKIIRIVTSYNQLNNNWLYQQKKKKIKCNDF